jgi:hypothetical protein
MKPGSGDLSERQIRPSAAVDGGMAENLYQLYRQ